MTRASPGPKAQWEQRLGEVAVDEDDLSRTVLDFLVADGHRDAVACFGREADLGPLPMSLSAAIHVRSAAVSATRSGDVSSGITQAIELSPEVRTLCALRGRRDELFFFFLSCTTPNVSMWITTTNAEPRAAPTLTHRSWTHTRRSFSI